MQTKQLKKYAAITTASILTLQLAGCGSVGSTTSVFDEMHEDLTNDYVSAEDVIINDEFVQAVDSEFNMAADIAKNEQPLNISASKE